MQISHVCHGMAVHCKQCLMAPSSPLILQNATACANYFRHTGRLCTNCLLIHFRFTVTSEAVEVRQHYDERLRRVLLQTLLLMRCLQECDRPRSQRSIADIALDDVSVKSVSRATHLLLASLLEGTSVTVGIVTCWQCCAKNQRASASPF